MHVYSTRQDLALELSLAEVVHLLRIILLPGLFRELSLLFRLFRLLALPV